MYVYLPQKFGYRRRVLIIVSPNCLLYALITRCRVHVRYIHMYKCTVQCTCTCTCRLFWSIQTCATNPLPFPKIDSIFNISLKMLLPRVHGDSLSRGLKCGQDSLPEIFPVPIGCSNRHCIKPHVLKELLCITEGLKGMYNFDIWKCTFSSTLFDSYLQSVLQSRPWITSDLNQLTTSCQPTMYIQIN